MSLLNGCRTCGEDFNGVSYFDAHRVGEYGPGDFRGDREDWSPELGRRCLSSLEMRERGWEKNGRGRWFDPTEAARGVSALHRSLQGPSEEAA